MSRTSMRPRPKFKVGDIVAFRGSVGHYDPIFKIYAVEEHFEEWNGRGMITYRYVETNGHITIATGF